MSARKIRKLLSVAGTEKWIELVSGALHKVAPDWSVKGGLLSWTDGKTQFSVHVSAVVRVAVNS